VRPGRATAHSPPSSAAVTEEKSYTSTHPLGHTGPVTGSHCLYIYIYIYIYIASVLVGRPEEGDDLKELRVHESMILK